MLNVRIFSLYPELFPGPLDIGLYKKARSKKIWSLEIINIRDYSKNKHKTVDDTPYGGGNGMLIRADVVGDALDKKIGKKNHKSPKKFHRGLFVKIWEAAAQCNPASLRCSLRLAR
jgi:tRNA (guanine37-N1)-methyltransferase